MNIRRPSQTRQKLELPDELAGNHHGQIQAHGTALHESWNLLSDCPIFNASNQDIRQLKSLIFDRELNAMADVLLADGASVIEALIRQDALLTDFEWPEDFQKISQSMALAQISMLAPMQDDRPIRTYLREIKNGKVHGWHCLTGALMYRVFSIPPRQALLHHASNYRKLISTAHANIIQDWEDNALKAVNQTIAAASDPGQAQNNATGPVFNPRIL